MNPSADPPAMHSGRASSLHDEADASDSSSLRNPPVAVAVLAAGLSRRMGALNKLVQEVDGQPMVRQVAMQALSSGCDRVFVVLGHEAEAVCAALSGLDVEFIHNPDYREGLAASVRAAARAARPGEALMICLGDMPQVGAAVVDRLIEAYRADAGGNVHGNAGADPSDADPGTHPPPGTGSRTTSRRVGLPPAAAYQPEFEGRRGNPVLWAPQALASLMTLRGDEGARALLKRLGGQVVAVPVRGDGIFMDIDTPQALQAAREQEKFPRT